MEKQGGISRGEMVSYWDAKQDSPMRSKLWYFRGRDQGYGKSKRKCTREGGRKESHVWALRAFLGTGPRIQSERGEMGSEDTKSHLKLRRRTVWRTWAPIPLKAAVVSH